MLNAPGTVQSLNWPKKMKWLKKSTKRRRRRGRTRRRKRKEGEGEKGGDRFPNVLVP